MSRYILNIGQITSKSADFNLSNLCTLKQGLQVLKKSDIIYKICLTPVDVLLNHLTFSSRLQYLENVWDLLPGGFLWLSLWRPG